MRELTFQGEEKKTLEIGQRLIIEIIDIQQIKRAGLPICNIIVKDVTPLEGYFPSGYGCGICGIITEAKPDGSLPEGWIKKEFEQGSMFICPEPNCHSAQVCRVCGCTEYNACETDDGPCDWVEPDLCSACVNE